MFWKSCLTHVLEMVEQIISFSHERVGGAGPEGFLQGVHGRFEVVGCHGDVGRVQQRLDACGAGGGRNTGRIPCRRGFVH